MSPELFVLLTDKGVREVVGFEVKFNSEQGTQLLDGVVSDRQIDVLLCEIVSLIKKENDKRGECADFILNHILEEIYEVLSEFEAVSMHVYSKVDADYNNRYQSSIKGIYIEQNKRKQELEKWVAQTQENYSIFTEDLSKIERESRLSFNKIKKDIKDVRDNNITVLGIFASIVLVFNASVSFYSAIIEAFPNMGIHKVIFLTALVGLIVLTAIFGLISFLDKIRSSKLGFKITIMFVLAFTVLVLMMNFAWKDGYLSWDGVNPAAIFANQQIEEEVTTNEENLQYHTNPKVPEIGL